MSKETDGLDSVYKDWPHCPQCGAPLDDGVFCGECGYEVWDEE